MTMENEAAVSEETAAEDQSFEEAFAEFSRPDPLASEPVPDQDEPPQEDEPKEEPKVEEPQTDVAAKLAAAEQAARDWEHRFKSEVGRQTALQRKVGELEAQLKERPQSQQAQRQYSDRMQALMQDFPEIATALQEELETQLAAVRNEVRQAVEPMKQQEEQRRYQAEEARVKEKYPDFAETVNSREFLDWFQTQPEAVRSLAASPFANDTLAVLDYYSATRPRPVENAEVQQIAQRRQQSLERNVSVRNSAPAPIADAPDDFEAAFNHYSRQRERGIR